MMSEFEEPQPTWCLGTSRKSGANGKKARYKFNQESPTGEDLVLEGAVQEGNDLWKPGGCRRRRDKGDEAAGDQDEEA